MASTNYLKVFNSQFKEFIEDVQNIFPDDAGLMASKKVLSLIRKANPKVIAGVWKLHITTKYKEQIMNGDINFFLNRSYATEIQDADKDILDYIDRLRTPLSQMNKENQDKAMKYIQNLTQLSEMIL